MDFSKVPFLISDIKFEQERTFKTCEQQWFEHRDDFTAARFHLAKGLCAITGIPEEELIDHIPFNIDNDPLLKFEEGEDAPDYILQNGHDVSLLRLYRHVATIIDSYEEPDTEFGSIVYKDEEYSIRGDLMYKAIEGTSSAVLGDGDLTTGEAVEVMQLRDQLSKLIEKRNTEMDDGTIINGSFITAQDWLITRKELAILLRKENDRLPFMKPAREEWIRQRADHFKDIDLKVVKDIRFFLIGSLGHYKSIDLISLFGKADLKPVIYPKKPKTKFQRNQK